MEDGEKILGEFGFGAGIMLVDNQEFAAVLLNQPLDEFKPEAGQTVSVGNHKSELISAVKPLQYGEQSFSLPVEASGDVSDDLGVGARNSCLESTTFYWFLLTSDAGGSA